jgi:HK97 family phage prohead protease
MPYFISQDTDCPEWAVVKDDDMVIACHPDKESAIAQMVAISIEENIEPGGERQKGRVKNKTYRELPDNYRPALAEDVPEGRACGNCFFFNEAMQNDEGTKAWCEKWEDYVDGGYYCNAWEPKEESRAAPDALSVGDFVSWNSSGGRARGKIERIVRDGEINVPDSSFTITGTEDDPAALIVVYRELEDGWRETDTRVGHKFSTLTLIDDLPLSEERDINQDAPAYMRAAARRGLEFHEQGLSGDGVTPQTIREARLMAEGTVSDDKWIRLAAWIARHLVDLDSPDADPDSDNYPSAGVVAHLLWGSGPTKRAAQRTKDYADSVVARIRAEETNSMDNKNKWLDVARAIALKIDGPVSKEPEVRVNSTQLEVRQDTADGMTFTGYASVFNSASEDLGGFIEYVAPGAFKRSLQSRNEIKLLWNHDTGEPLASLRGGTMQLVEDRTGLKVTATLPNTTRGRDVAELLRTKVIDSMSFGFNVIRDSWSGDGKTRTLESVRLSEVSIVSFPAYSSTTATVRSQPTINPDELADALLKLESGEELDEAQASLITDVVGKLKSSPEVEEVIDNGLELLDIKKKQLDLLLKRI